MQHLKSFFLVAGFHNIKFQGYLFCTGESLNAPAIGECSSYESVNAPGVHRNGETGFLKLYQDWVFETVSGLNRNGETGFSKLYLWVLETVGNCISGISSALISSTATSPNRPLAANKFLHDSSECSTNSTYLGAG